MAKKKNSQADAAPLVGEKEEFSDSAEGPEVHAKDDAQASAEEISDPVDDANEINPDASKSKLQDESTPLKSESTEGPEELSLMRDVEKDEVQAHFAESSEGLSSEVENATSKEDSSTTAEESKGAESVVVSAGAAEISSSEPDESVAKKSPKKNKFGGKKPIPTKLTKTTQKDDLADVLPPTASAEVLNTAEILEEIKRIDTELKSSLPAVELKKKETEAIQANRVEQEQELSRIDDKIARQEDSYFWNIKQAMDKNLGQAKSDLLAFEEQAKSLDIPEPGELVKIRKIFHRNLGRAVLTYLIPVALLFLIPYTSSGNLLNFLLNGLDRGWLIPAVVIVSAFYIGILGLIQRGLKRNSKKLPWRKIIPQWAWILGVIAYVALHIWAPDFLRDQVVPFVLAIRALTITTLSIGLFFTVVGFLISYYSKWSEFRRRVVEQYTNLENVVNGYISTKKEIARLENLYQQLSEWLEVIAHSVYRPWRVNEKWKTKTAVEALSETMPRALRIAEAIESESSETARLEKLIADHLLVQGWRNHAFEDSLKQIAGNRGLSSQALSPDQLDRDLPHQPNNTRKLVLEAFRAAARMEPDPEAQTYLEKVARSKVSELVGRAQKFALSEAQPKVELIVKDPLRALMGNGVDETSTVVTSDWDGFLSKNLGLEEAIQPPLSTLTFTDEGIMRELHKPVTFVLAPVKLIKKLESITSDSVTLTSVETGLDSPRAEVVVRLDVTSAVTFENIKLLSAGSSKQFVHKLSTNIDHEPQDL